MNTDCPWSLQPVDVAGVTLFGVSLSRGLLDSTIVGDLSNVGDEEYRRCNRDELNVTEWTSIPIWTSARRPAVG